MARRKKRAAPVAKDATPDQTRRKELGVSRLQFQRLAVDKECDRVYSDMVKIGEKLVKVTNEAEEDFRQQVPADIGNMTLKDLFEAGYILDYGAPSSDTFIALAPMHYEIKQDSADTVAPPSQRKMAAPRQTLGSARPKLSELPEAFATPAPGVISANNMFITPKVVMRPKRGHIVLYTENGSPYQLNLKTMMAKPSEESATPATAPRTTRATRASKRQ